MVGGKDIDIWADKWLQGSPTRYLRPHLPVSVNIPRKAEALIDWEHRQWDLTTVSHLLSSEESVEIQMLPIGERDSYDRLIWPLAKNGMYTVKTGYLWTQLQKVPKPKIKPNTSHTIMEEVWKIIWSSKTIPKIKLFLWRAVKRVLPTLFNLFKRTLTENPICQICKVQPETIEHILLQCPWAIKVWSAIHISSKYTSHCYS